MLRDLVQNGARGLSVLGFWLLVGSCLVLMWQFWRGHRTSRVNHQVLRIGFGGIVVSLILTFLADSLDT